MVVCSTIANPLLISTVDVASTEVRFTDIDLNMAGLLVPYILLPLFILFLLVLVLSFSEICFRSSTSTATASSTSALVASTRCSSSLRNSVLLVVAGLLDVATRAASRTHALLLWTLATPVISFSASKIFLTSFCADCSSSSCSYASPNSLGSTPKETSTPSALIVTFSCKCRRPLFLSSALLRRSMSNIRSEMESTPGRGPAAHCAK